MNEQIRELVRKAGGHFSTRNLMSNPPQQVEFIELWDDRIEKFALLIVQQCGSVGDHWVDNLDDGKNLISQRLKQHFGFDS